MKATAKDYVRASQIRLILELIVDRLHAILDFGQKQICSRVLSANQKGLIREA
jgi:hypothetical protein